MTQHFRAAFGIGLLAALSGFMACKSSSDARHIPGESAGGEAGTAELASEAGQTDQAGETSQAGKTAAGGGAGGSVVTRGLILLTQATVKSEALMIDSAHFGLSATFVSRAEVMREQAAASTTTVGDCTASVVTIDPNAPRVQPAPSLNAGTITVTGIGMPPSLVLDYTENADAGPPGYSHGEGDTRFYEGGDVVTVRGSGGADLPAFKVESLKAPSDIAVTAPSCVTGSCPDIDHDHDLLVEWENGGDGKVDVLFETIADTKVVLLECKFDAQEGKGLIPAALLGKLDPVDGVDVSGIQQISPIDEVTFLVGDVSTTFSIRTAQFEALLGSAN